MTFFSESVVEDAASVLGRVPIGIQFDSNSAPILGFDRCGRKRSSGHHLGSRGPTSGATSPGGWDRAIYRSTVARKKRVAVTPVPGEMILTPDNVLGAMSPSSATSFPNLLGSLPNLSAILPSPGKISRILVRQVYCATAAPEA